MKFTIDIEVPDAKLTGLAGDLITTAVEGGINYWAQVSGYQWDGVPVQVTVHEIEPSEDQKEAVVCKVTTVEMVQAIGDLVAGRVKAFSSMGYGQTFRDRLIAWMTGNEDDFDFDANDADAMMQIACLGEVVYG